jgi:hypothetical protein
MYMYLYLNILYTCIYMYMYVISMDISGGSNELWEGFIHGFVYMDTYMIIILPFQMSENIAFVNTCIYIYAI